MDLRTALPSAQFALVVASLALSGAFVFAADWLTREPEDGRLTAETQTQPVVSGEWQTTLAQLQAENSVLPPPPPQEAYQALLTEAQSSESITGAISRTLFIQLSNANAQGLGSDIPTQDQLIAGALNQINQTPPPAYIRADLTIVADSQLALRAYGNTIMQILLDNPGASVNETLLAVGSAVDTNDQTHFQKLAPIETAYKNIARTFLSTPVPESLSPLHLSLVNNFAGIASVYADLRAMPTDPLRGLAGLQGYQALTHESRRVFTTIAEQLRNSAILFNEEEAGSAWSAFLAASPL
jgi:hypothetical protein